MPKDFKDMLRIVRITTFISFDICSKCDQIKCSRDSQLWRIFRRCGHSFHLECNLPDISACPICQDLLKSKAESLGKTTNDAVKNFKNKPAEGSTNSDEETSDDEEDSRDDEEYIELLEPTNEEHRVESLLSKIASWKHVQAPTN